MATRCLSELPAAREDARLDGQPHPPKPEDRLRGGRGPVIANHFVSTSICTSSRASLFTGLCPRSQKVNDFEIGFPEAQYQRAYLESLRRAGYRRAFLGKRGARNQMPADRLGDFRGFAGLGRYVSKRPDEDESVYPTESMGVRPSNSCGVRRRNSRLASRAASQRRTGKMRPREIATLLPVYTSDNGPIPGEPDLSQKRFTHEKSICAGSGCAARSAEGR